jgi:hypothetical protein
MRIVLWLCLLLSTAGTAHAQVSAGGSWLFTQRPDLAEGPGAWLRLTVPLTSAIRVEGEAGREWGARSRMEGTCLHYWPEPVDCVAERVEYQNTATRLGGHVVLLAPTFAGVRAGLGGGLEVYSLDVGTVGRTTGRESRPASTDVHGASPSFLVLVEYSLDRLTLDARAQQLRLDFGDCVMDTWDVCGTTRFRRLSLGASYRFR